MKHKVVFLQLCPTLARFSSWVFGINLMVLVILMEYVRSWGPEGFTGSQNILSWMDPQGWSSPSLKWRAPKWGSNSHPWHYQHHVLTKWADLGACVPCPRLKFRSQWIQWLQSWKVCWEELFPISTSGSGGEEFLIEVAEGARLGWKQKPQGAAHWGLLKKLGK